MSPTVRAAFVSAACVSVLAHGAASHAAPAAAPAYAGHGESSVKPEVLARYAIPPPPNEG